MNLTLMFVVVFMIGPCAFWALCRNSMTKQYLVALLGIEVIMIALAFALAKWAVPVSTFSPYSGVLFVLLLWLAWIVVLVLCILAVRVRLPSGQSGRWAFSMGAMATTLPWFGLYIAQMVTAT